MAIDETLKEYIRKALSSHESCAHNDASMCYSLVLCEVEMLLGRLLEEEEIEQCRNVIADTVLEGLILKGMVEVTGISEDGEFMVGLTETGEESYNEIREEREEQGNEGN